MTTGSSGGALWIHAVSDGVIALSCFVILAALFYLAFRHRAKRLSRVFYVFGALFLFGGLVHACEVAHGLSWWRHAFALGSVFKAVTALWCVACAAVTVRCAGAALASFSRLSVLERRVRERLRELDTSPRYDTREDREWARTLRELNGVVQKVVAIAPPDTGERGVNGC